VLVHGGFWRARYGLDLEHALAADLVARGWTVWNVEYRRLGDGGGWPETVADVVAAIRALPVDASRIVAIGHSAGGHLATWASAHVSLDGVVSQAGALDPFELWRVGASDNVVADLLRGSPKSALDRYLEATPQPPPGVPLLLVHGALDEDVPVSISRKFAAQHGADLVVIEDEGHMEHLDPGSQCWRAVIEWL
jgi:pimeloyl-ACP methyl ester carboxylesterase